MKNRYETMHNTFEEKHMPEELYLAGRSLLLNDTHFLYKIREHEPYDDTDYVMVLREPEGPNAAGELSDTFYFTPENGAKPLVSGYHEHRGGFEMFMVEGENAKCLIGSHGKQTFAYPGDLVFLPPYASHQFHWYGSPLRWRELFSGMNMNPNMRRNWRIKEFSPNAFEDASFTEIYRRTDDYRERDFEMKLEDADNIPEVIRFDQGHSRFELGGIRFLEKVTHSMWWGQREIWQMFLPAGTVLDWSFKHPEELLLMLYSGRIRVEIPGVEPFEIGKLDYLDIPAFLQAKLTVLDDAVLFDYNCEGLFYCGLEELNARVAAEGTDLLQDETRVREILEKHNIYLYFHRA